MRYVGTRTGLVMVTRRSSSLVALAAVISLQRPACAGVPGPKPIMDGRCGGKRVPIEVVLERRECERCQLSGQQGIATLNRGQPNNVSREAFVIIRGSCAQQWPDDYSMRQHCESR